MDPDPWKRWTAHQASQHPFVTGDINEAQLRAREFHWLAPWDPSICHRKLLSVKKAREKNAHLRHEKISRNSGLSSNTKSKQVIQSQALEPPPITQILHNGELLPEIPSQPPLSTEVNA